MKKTFTILSLFFCLSLCSTANAQEAFIGEIRMFGGTYAPVGWAKCDGQLLQISQNSALFSILGTIYGGDGRTTFALPDLRGRVPMHNGTGPGLPAYEIGEKGGSATTNLTVANLPSHNHQVNGVVEEGNSDSPTNNYPANTKLLDKEYASNGTATAMNAGMIGSTGSNEPINNMQPFQTVTYIIAIQGIYPSRQ
jgi:microcystin-dependent protein